jgi:hypothetical protein
MAAATLPEPMMMMMEPMGLVVQDGGDEHRHPRICLFLWAVEEETDEDERH